MKPRITLITLGVDDLETAVRFYRDGLGLQTDGIVGTEFAYGAVAFFDLQAGLKLALWPRTSMAHDTGLMLGSPSPTACTSKRSGCQNITLAITPSDGIPCRHGYAPLITPGTLGTDSTGNPSPH
jgi:catechol 2,3-dioxygenase-like lactoylglutathione lyase family enzyme